MLLYPLALWVCFVIVSVLTVVLRETTLAPRFGEPTAQIAGTAVLVGTILVASAIYFARTTDEYRGVELLLVGVVWLLLSVQIGFIMAVLLDISFERTVVHFTGTVGPGWIPVVVSLLLAPLASGTALRAE